VLLFPVLNFFINTQGNPSGYDDANDKASVKLLNRLQPQNLLPSAAAELQFLAETIPAAAKISYLRLQLRYSSLLRQFQPQPAAAAAV
jgi:hypothetical protein